MKNLADDIRFAVRGFIRNPAFTVTSVATLAVGMGATTAVFALLNGVLLQPLPVERQAELVELALERTDGSGTPTFTYPQYMQIREHSPGLAGVAAYDFTEYGVSVPGTDPELLPVHEVSGNYFEVLGVRPARGRLFTGESERPGGELVTVLSHGFWLRHFGGADDAVGRTLLVNGQQLTVLGVAPQEFRGTVPLAAPELWVPITARPLLQPGSDIHHPGMMFWLSILGRLEPGTGRPQAEALLSSAVRALDASDSPAPFTHRQTSRAPAEGIRLAPLRSVPAHLAGVTAGFMALLFTTAAFVLLIAAVNITSMQLARSTARARELSVRRSLGATRARVTRQLLTENVLLFLMGAGAGLVVAVWFTAALPALTTSIAESASLGLHIPIDNAVLLFALATALLMGLVFGLAPALHATGGDLMSTLREGMSPLRGTRLRSSFVVGQIALSLVLLATAGLLGRTLQRGLSADPGFDAAGVALAEVDLRPYGYDAEAARLFLSRLRDRLDARDDIAVSGVSNMQPLMGWSTLFVRPEGQEVQGSVLTQTVDGGYLQTLRVPLRAGRYFDRSDRAGAPAVAIVNEAFVRRFWPDGDAVGRRIHHGPPDDESLLEVVGVVATGMYRSLSEEPQPFLLLPVDQSTVRAPVIFARGAAGRGAGTTATIALQQTLRNEIRELDVRVPVRTGSLDATVGMLLTPQRIAAAAIGSFGLLGLLLAALGIYGVVAFSAAQRAREVAVRLALGSPRRGVVLLFLRQGARLLIVGSVLGLIVALAAAKMLTALLHGVSPADPLTFATVPLLLGAAVLLAAYLPARRASRSDPMMVLRGD